MQATDNPYAPWATNFRLQMKHLRELKEMTQTDMAKALKSRGLAFHQQTVQRIETGERPVKLDEAFLIAHELGVDLETMTSGDAPKIRDLRFAVDGLRRKSDIAMEGVEEVLGDWEEAFEYLAYEVLLQLEAAPQEPSPEVIWGAAWMRKALWAYDAMYEALTYLNGLSSGGGNWREDLRTLPNEVAQDMEHRVDGDTDYWETVPETLKPEYMGDKDPADLYREVPRSEDDNGEHKETR